jgi:hypothetical protein
MDQQRTWHLCLAKAVKHDLTVMQAVNDLNHRTGRHKSRWPEGVDPQPIYEERNLKVAALWPQFKRSAWSGKELF